jgi:hypothetical protein
VNFNGKPETSFPDFWSTSSAIYAPDDCVSWALVRCIESTRSGPKVWKTRFSPATASTPDFGTCCLKYGRILCTIAFRMCFGYGGGHQASLASHACPWEHMPSYSAPCVVPAHGNFHDCSTPHGAALCERPSDTWRFSQPFLGRSSRCPIVDPKSNRETLTLQVRFSVLIGPLKGVDIW